MEHIEIDQQEYHLLLKYLKIETGLNFEYYRQRFIEKRIKARMIRVNCKTLQQYNTYLNKNIGEIKKFVDGFTINYTFFFRDYDVFETFQDIFIDGLNVKKGVVSSNIRPSANKLNKFRTKHNYVKNQMKAEKASSKPEASYIDLFIFLNRLLLYKKLMGSRTRENEIKIWSCPCATGEEPYSIAMILDNLEEQVPNFPKYQIIASDIAIEAINKAKKGLYTDDSMKEISNYYENKYFKKKKLNFGYINEISEEIKNKVDFVHEDVTLGHKRRQKYDVIFCRYLLIYFNRTNRDKFLKILESRLEDNGILILGKTETLFKEFGSLKQIDSRNHIYIKSHSKLI